MFVGLPLVSCGGGDDDTDGQPPPPTGGAKTIYTANVKSIIDGQCIKCHGAGGVQSGRPFETYAQVSASATAIAARIKGTGGGIMPPTGKLSDATIAVIDKWIADGKLN